MELHKWDEIAEEQITPLLTRRFVSGEKMTVARFFLKKGCVVAAHSHPNEQMSTILSGALKFVIDGREVIVGAGETLHIPANTPHSAEAMEDTDALDVFSPTRSDWVEGRDDYLRGKPQV
ncbi:MAG TPA: cupin domain-containing protein [Blastocatellia bacterium]|nr:cupin domain-containing protein [Blastocatellia bacterium]